MAGSGFVWGGLLQGIGQGMAAKGQSDLEERRRIALESLRHGNALSEAQADAVLKNDLNARQVERQLNADIVRDGVRTDNDIRVEGVKAVSARDLENLRTRNDKDLARLKAGLDAANDAASARLKAEIEAGQVNDVRVTQDGSYVVFKKNGQVINTGIKAAPKDVQGGRGTGGAGSVLGGLGLGTPGASPAPGATEPAEPAPAKPAPVKPAAPAPRAPSTGRGIQAPRAGNRGAPAAGQKTYTTADAQATAVKNNVPIEEVHRRMRDAGYKLVGA